MPSKVVSFALLAGLALSGCSFLAEQVTDESFERQPDMERVRAQVLGAIELQPDPGEGSPRLRARGGDPKMDGSQRYVVARGRLRGDAAEALSRLRDELTEAGFVVIEEEPSDARGTELRATIEDLAVLIQLFEEGNPDALPAEQDMVYAHVEVALRDSEGSVLRWTHID